MFSHGVRHFRVALLRAFQHDALLVAKGAAYSSMMTFFPALLVLASVLAKSQQAAAFVRQLSVAIGAILPPGTAEMAVRYFDAKKHNPLHVLWSASLITFFASTGVLISWMQGFRRAYGIDPNPWGLVHERLVAIALVPSALLPMAIATMLVAFGNQIENWMAPRVLHELRPVLFILWTVTRWGIALLTSILVLALVYHFAIPRERRPWHQILPGATLATALWFPATLVFGWYVTNYANYTVIYGSLGAAIALLVWLYMLSLIVLIGAEFNATVFPRTRGRAAHKTHEPRVPERVQ